MSEDVFRFVGISFLDFNYLKDLFEFLLSARDYKDKQIRLDISTLE